MNEATALLACMGQLEKKSKRAWDNWKKIKLCSRSCINSILLLKLTCNEVIGREWQVKVVQESSLFIF